MDTNYKIKVKIDIKATNATQANDIQGNNDSYSIIRGNRPLFCTLFLISLDTFEECPCYCYPA